MLIKDSSRVEIHENSWQNLMDHMNSTKDKQLTRMLDSMKTTSEQIVAHKIPQANLKLDSSKKLANSPGADTYVVISVKDNKAEYVKIDK